MAQELKPIYIQDVQINGLKHFSQQEIHEILNLPGGAVFSLDNVRQQFNKLLQEYRGQGFYFATIDSVTIQIDSIQQQANIKLFLQENTRLKIESLKIKGLLPEETRNWSRRFETQPGDNFNEDVLQEDIEAGLKLAENSGYPLTEVRIDSLMLSRDPAHTLKLILHIASGYLIKIDEITIQGNQITLEKVIQREIRIKNGEIYQQNQITKIPRRLLRLGFLKEVQTPQIYIKEDGRSGLLITVQEGNANQFDGVVGYTPGTITRKGYFTGLLNLSLGNLLGTGRKVSANWQKKDRQSQSLAFSYFEPWILGFPLHTSFQFNQLIQDTTYIQRNWIGEIQFPFSDNFYTFGRIGWQGVFPDSIGMLLFNIPPSRANNLTLGLAYDTRDDLVNPRKGLYFHTSVEIARKKNLANEILALLEKDEIHDLKRLGFDFSLFVPISGNQVLSSNLFGRQITSSEKNIPIPEHFRLGGTRTLRGYREEQFRGTRIAWMNLEYRYLLGRRSRVFLFGDMGYFSRPDPDEVKIEAYKVSYGFGLRLETRLGIMGVDYGLGEGSGLLEGLIHVGLINEF
ncbi:BamA/TamA family outer membrane protein [candidate division KSB1 bacterium]|nr:BamA/TamA family outer membrane protein [candidate division KSB1 bacterium]